MTICVAHRRSVAVAFAVIGLLSAATPARAGAPEAVTVREPAFGLPHFYAATDVAMARENGREIAKDRLGQLILLARVGRGTLSEVFALLDPSTLDDDIVARQTAYTSRELNDMFAKLPQRERDIVVAYCEGVNDTIDQVYAGAPALPEPIEVSILRLLGYGNNLFGNSANISDQVDPYFKTAAEDPEHPNAGFQFTPEMTVAIAILEVRNFGLESFDEPSRLRELQMLIARHGDADGAQIWDDYNFLNDPLAPVSVPDPTTPGYGGPLAGRRAGNRTALASAAARQPRYDYDAAAERRRAAAAHREQFASLLGAWPKLGSYAWAIAGNRSATGFPWIGGFPQTGIQTPSIMHFAENRTDEGIVGIGMEFAGAPFILIGHTDHVAFTTTTALLRTVETFFESIVNENADALRYNDEGTPAPLVPRTEIFRGAVEVRKVMWRSHERHGNHGSRPVLNFVGDTSGVASAGSATTLDAAGAFTADLTDGYIAIVGGTAAGEIRHIAAVVGNDRVEIDAGSPWTASAGSEFVAVRPGNHIVAVTIDSPLWLEETTTAFGFSLFQRATDVLGIKRGTRLIPSTHNFIAADNQPFNGIGTQSGSGNIGYWATGFSRIRNDDTDVRLPIDGGISNPFVIAQGTVASAGATTLTASAAAFSGLQLAPPPVNFRYQNPTEKGREYIVAITGGSGYKQTRRIASNDDSSLTIEYPWGMIPSVGDSFEVYAIVAMPEAVNPSEGYMANWNNKAATADDGNNFGRQWRHLFILERLGAETAWDRAKQRQLNEDLAGLDGKGDFGRFLLPRLREAVNGVGTGGNAAIETVLSQLESHQAAPSFGRYFIDPVEDMTTAGEVAFLNQLVNNLAMDIYGDELNGAVPVPTGGKALSLVQHAIDSAAGDLAGGYSQAFAGDYFNGGDWRVVVRDSLGEMASAGIPPDGERPVSRYNHPLAELNDALRFPTTPQGNRGTYEQIVDVGPQVTGEFIFPLGQSGLIEGSLGEVTAIDPNFTSLHPIWRDWRFVPMLPIARDIAANGSADSDGDEVPDAYERWYFGDLSKSGDDDSDSDRMSLRQEALQGVDATAADTDGDGIRDGFDTNVRDRLGDSKCGGDCDADLNVSVDELVRAVNITLGLQPLEQCTVADFDGDGEVNIGEIIRAVNATLVGCAV